MRMRMKRTVTRLMAPVVGLATALTLVAGCATTNISSSWVTPGARPVTFDNTLVVFMHPVETTRRAAEEYLVARIGPDRAVASYTVISQDEVRDTARAKVTVRNAGFDGVVVLRVIGVEERVNLEGVATPPNYEQGFWDYYEDGWPSVYEPDRLPRDTIVSVETNVYSVTEDRLLWSGVSETFNPWNLEGAIDDIADAVSAELRRVGLLAN